MKFGTLLSDCDLLELTGLASDNLAFLFNASLTAGANHCSRLYHPSSLISTMIISCVLFCLSKAQELGEQPIRPTPKTLDNTREPNETIVLPGKVEAVTKKCTENLEVHFLPF